MASVTGILGYDFSDKYFEPRKQKAAKRQINPQTLLSLFQTYVPKEEAQKGLVIAEMQEQFDIRQKELFELKQIFSEQYLDNLKRLLQFSNDETKLRREGIKAEVRNEKVRQALEYSENYQGKILHSLISNKYVGDQSYKEKITSKLESVKQRFPIEKQKEIQRLKDFIKENKLEEIEQNLKTIINGISKSKSIEVLRRELTSNDLLKKNIPGYNNITKKASSLARSEGAKFAAKEGVKRLLSAPSQQYEKILNELKEEIHDLGETTANFYNASEFSFDTVIDTVQRQKDPVTTDSRYEEEFNEEYRKLDPDLKSKVTAPSELVTNFEEWDILIENASNQTLSQALRDENVQEQLEEQQEQQEQEVKIEPQQILPVEGDQGEIKLINL